MAQAETGRPARVLVVGAGAIGALYGGMLARAGAEVSVVCRSDHDAVAASGFDIQTSWGDFVFRPAHVLRAAADVAEPPDYILLAVKMVRGVDRPALIRQAIGPHTVIVLVGNGIGIEQELADAFPHNELISVLAFVAATRTGPAAVRHQALGRLVMGSFPEGVSPAVQRLASLFAQAGVPCDAQPRVADARWLKNLWNIAFNPISALGGGLDTQAILAPAEGTEFVRRVMREAAAVAAASGSPIADEVIENTIASTRAMAPYKTSMAIDYLAGRPMEIEPILGNVVRAARTHGVPVPGLEALYALACMVQYRDEVGARAV